MGFSIKTRKYGRNTEQFLENVLKINYRDILDYYGRLGCIELAEATPKDSGVTADSWDYVIEKNQNGYTLTWTNSSLDDSRQTPIVILLQYGHGTNSGTYVSGIDFINPTMKNFFNDISRRIWREVEAIE